MIRPSTFVRLLLPVLVTLTPFHAEARAPAFTPATLTISTTDGRTREIPVRSERQLRAALKPCFGKMQCEAITIETCDRCFMQAEAVHGGYVIHSRLGPPGPCHELRDMRAKQRGSRNFWLKDVVTILADYLTGRETIMVERINTGEL